MCQGDKFTGKRTECPVGLREFGPQAYAPGWCPQPSCEGLTASSWGRHSWRSDAWSQASSFPISVRIESGKFCFMLFPPRENSPRTKINISPLLCLFSHLHSMYHNYNYLMFHLKSPEKRDTEAFKTLSTWYFSEYKFFFKALRDARQSCIKKSCLHHLPSHPLLSRQFCGPEASHTIFLLIQPSPNIRTYLGVSFICSFLGNGTLNFLYLFCFECSMTLQVSDSESTLKFLKFICTPQIEFASLRSYHICRFFFLVQPFLKQQQQKTCFSPLFP